MYPVVVPDPAKAVEFFKKRDEKKWRYNVFWRNCKTYVLKGLRIGGADVDSGGPLPEVWENSDRQDTWDSLEDVP